MEVRRNNYFYLLPNDILNSLNLQIAFFKVNGIRCFVCSKNECYSNLNYMKSNILK